MKIEIRHNGLFETCGIDISLYNRGDELGIDFNNSKSQIKLTGVSPANARQMIRELEAYIAGKEIKPKQHETL